MVLHVYVLGYNMLHISFNLKLRGKFISNMTSLVSHRSETLHEGVNKWDLIVLYSFQFDIENNTSKGVVNVLNTSLMANPASAQL